ncbi:DUF4132 domain-containing protein [Bacillus pseudomycoides]|uniref:DUF4132 domain-containing protein n=1 Tax=Bacillus pseudomycoides TaxID=64104 RepID=UPI000BFCF6D0|nr:DUF4132 domain-containing protein [Bacillus pseudomycoides]PHB15863.1 MolR family transcriptional regulator [Bacillus pseudomycoides]
MAVSTYQLFQHLNMTGAQEELALRYLQTRDEEVLKHIEQTTICENKRSDFAWQFTNDFRKTYKQDPVFFRLFYHLLEDQLLNVLLVRFTRVSFTEMKVYFEKSDLSLDLLVASACKYLTNLSRYVNGADVFIRQLIRENPEYIEGQLQVLTGQPKLVLLLLLLGADYERFLTYSSLLEEELQEHAEYILRLNGAQEKIELAKRYVQGESVSEVSVGSSLPDVTWQLLFRVYQHSNVARRYMDLLAKRSVKNFMDYATDHVCRVLDQFGNHVRTRSFDKQAYETIRNLCEQFGVSEERFFAYRLTRRHLGILNFDQVYEYQLLLRMVEEQPEFVQRTLQYLSNSHYLFVAMLLAEKGYEFNRNRVREEFLTIALQSESSDIRDTYRDYLVGKLSFEDMKQVLESSNHQSNYGAMSDLAIALLWDKEEAVKREAALKLQFGNDYNCNLYELLHRCSHIEGSLEQMLEDLLSYGLSKEKLVYYSVKQAARNSGKENKAKEALVRLFVKEQAYVTETFTEYSADERIFILDELAKNDAVKTRALFIQSLGDSSKKVRAAAVEFLTKDVEAAEDVAKELNSRKKVVRENVMQTLLYYKSEKYTQLVQEALQEQKNASLMEKFAPLLGDEGLEGASGSIEALCTRILTPQKRNALVQWLGFEPQIRLRNSDTIADATLPLAYFQQYVSESVIEKKEAAEAIGVALNEQDLKENIQAIYQLWISQGAEVKKRGILSMYGIHSDDEMALLLKKQIDEWAVGMRGAIAAAAVQALALSSSHLALMTINTMAFKYKHKQVRNAAKEALSLAAKTRGITEEELEDQLVPDLGFNKRGEKTIDYGGRTFTAYLTPNLKIELKTEEGKRIKSLPKPNAKDHAEKAEEAKAELSSIKKQLRSIISMQTQRLEMALSLNRYWSQHTWKSLFVENPIMQQFAISLIWGEYKEGKLLAMFRYMEDGTFNTIDEEEHELTQDTVIGLIHPLELSEEERELWKEQLEDYEVIQPFPQIAREVFLAAENEGVTVERFAGIQINGRSLFGKVTKYGWNRGSVEDAGVYYSFYKEDTRTGLGAELAFEGAPVGYEEEDDVCLFEIQFYKAGTVSRGSYSYDEVDDARRIVPKQVPERFFSEILYDIKRTTESNLGRDENWRSKR